MSTWPGGTPTFSPGSSDLDLTVKIVSGLQTMKCPPAAARHIARRWGRYTDDVAPFDGEAMIHADINPGNLLITPDDHVYVVDWGFTSRGAAWVELAILVQWLIGNGHTPRQAEEWVSQFPSWRAADPAAIDLLAQINATRWCDVTAAYGSPSWAVSLAGWVQQWAAYRQA